MKISIKVKCNNTSKGVYVDLNRNLFKSSVHLPKKKTKQNQNQKTQKKKKA